MASALRSLKFCQPSNETNIASLRSLFHDVHAEAADLYEKVIDDMAWDTQPYWDEEMRQEVLEFVTRHRPLSPGETLEMRIDAIEKAEQSQLLLFPKDSYDNYLNY